MSRPLWKDATTAFLIHALASGRATNTVDSYRDTLVDFDRTIHPGPISEILPGEISRYALHLYATRSRNTVRLRLLGLRVFFDYCMRVGWAKTNPARHLDVPAGEEPAVWPFSYAELRRLSEACTGPRERALFAILLTSNCRAPEIADMRMEHIDWERGRIQVNGKGNKRRWVAPGKIAMRCLAEYLAAERRKGDGWLWRGQRGKMTRSGLYRMLQECGDKVGIPHVHPHRFRHTFATHFLAQGGREGDLMLIMGHTTPVMSRRYARTDEARRALEAQDNFAGQMEDSLEIEVAR